MLYSRIAKACAESFIVSRSCRRENKIGALSGFENGIGRYDAVVLVILTATFSRLKLVRLGTTNYKLVCLIAETYRQGFILKFLYCVMCTYFFSY